mgnify:CR=1 FL=1
MSVKAYVDRPGIRVVLLDSSIPGEDPGRLREALIHYTKAGAIRPRATTYSNIGTIHFWEGDYASAADAYRRAGSFAMPFSTTATRSAGRPGRT